MSTTNREFGTVATWNGSYCFVTPDNPVSDYRDVFCHTTECQLPPRAILRNGDRVSFELHPDARKPGRLCARALRLADAEPDAEPVRGMYGLASDNTTEK